MPILTWKIYRRDRKLSSEWGGPTPLRLKRNCVKFAQRWFPRPEGHRAPVSRNLRSELPFSKLVPSLEADAVGHRSLQHRRTSCAFDSCGFEICRNPLVTAGNELIRSRQVQRQLPPADHFCVRRHSRSLRSIQSRLRAGRCNFSIASIPYRKTATAAAIRYRFCVSWRLCETNSIETCCEW